MQLSIVLVGLVSLLATSVSASPSPVDPGNPRGVILGTCTTGGNGVCNVRELHHEAVAKGNGRGWKDKAIPCSPDKKPDAPAKSPFESYKNRTEIEGIRNRQMHSLYAEMTFQCAIPAYQSSLVPTEIQKKAMDQALIFEEHMNRNGFMPAIFNMGWEKTSVL
ncbi:hypothetical protein B0H63DRAFT_529139 [Podospora didyma]|uniref:Uncharacterized protein n=1 Tax=Podospora didyma TaxID=330526 RepID=A0AAE0N2R6_9PEZI|nr:hypothetical protein B0H63DRAFT_529139 [Podospora didyma]